MFSESISSSVLINFPTQETLLYRVFSSAWKKLYPPYIKTEELS